VAFQDLGFRALVNDYDEYVSCWYIYGRRIAFQNIVSEKKGGTGDYLFIFGIFVKGPKGCQKWCVN
jgi:hypothetical protein